LKIKKPQKKISPASRNDMIMPAYYFAVEGYKTGETTDPATDKLITLQYQKIDLTTGEPLDKLVILKEWKSSEQEIVTSFCNEFFKPGTPVTQFIPVGLNLDYAYEMLVALFRKYNLPLLTSHELYYQRPRFDLKPLIVLLNDGRFAGASLNSFSLKPGEDRHMEKWYDKKDFDRIEHYVRDEAGRFLKVLQYLSKYKTRLGITRKEATVSRRNPYKDLPAGPAPVSPTSPRPPVQGMPSVKNAAQAGKHIPNDSPKGAVSSSTRLPAKAGQFVKKATDGDYPPRNRPAAYQGKGPRPLMKSPERTPAERKKAPASSNQLGKHPSAKNSSPKKSTGKRR
jgi:hypothetical protein